MKVILLRERDEGYSYRNKSGVLNLIYMYLPLLLFTFFILSYLSIFFILSYLSIFLWLIFYCINFFFRVSNMSKQNIIIPFFQYGMEFIIDAFYLQFRTEEKSHILHCIVFMY